MALAGALMVKGLLWPGAGRSCMVFANGTLKGREGKEEPGCPSLNRGCQLRKEGLCSCLFAGGCRQHENCLKSLINTGIELW